MTLKEASEIFYINIEIKKLRDELRDIEESRAFYKPIILSDMPRGGAKEYEGPSDKYLDERFRIEQILNYTLRRLETKRREFEEFLRSVDDVEIRLILRLRCVNNLSWAEIGEEAHMDRRTASRKFYRFFKDAHNAHSECDSV